MLVKVIFNANRRELTELGQKRTGSLLQPENMAVLCNKVTDSLFFLLVVRVLPAYGISGNQLHGNSELIPV